MNGRLGHLAAASKRAFFGSWPFGLTWQEGSFALFLLFAYGTGVYAHVDPVFYPLTRYSTDPLLLIVNGTILYLLYQRNRDQRLLIWSAITFIGTFFIEALGVATGDIFGEYTYGATMRVQWLGVPFVIALNWTILIIASNDLAVRVVGHPVMTSFVTSGFIALYDFFIEPVAIHLDYWTWAAPEIPLRNYFAWSTVAFLFSLPLNYLKIRFQSPLLPIYLVIQLLFFILLNLLLL